jgi:hypothetical protein
VNYDRPIEKNDEDVMLRQDPVSQTLPREKESVRLCVSLFCVIKLTFTARFSSVRVIEGHIIGAMVRI